MSTPKLTAAESQKWEQLAQQQQQTLQAAQMSFKTMSGLSLFNYIT